MFFSLKKSNERKNNLINDIEETVKKMEADVLKEKDNLKFLSTPKVFQEDSKSYENHIKKGYNPLNK